MRHRGSYPYDEEVLFHATDTRTGEQFAVGPGNGTDDWIASMWNIGGRNHRKGVIELHNETMVDQASLDCFEFETLTGGDIVQSTVERRLKEEA